MLLNTIMFLFDPFGIVRKFVMDPIADFSFAIYQHYREKTKEKAINARELSLRFGIISFAFIIIIWTAIFMYIAFYYTYMPAITQTRPVFMEFEACTTKKGVCSYPHAHISLTKNTPTQAVSPILSTNQLLMVGQSYKILIDINMPESPQNQDIGMFMVCADLRAEDGKLRAYSCRPTMLRYKSSLLRTLTTWILLPLYILGAKEERQVITVELFNNFVEDKSHRVTDIYVDIQSLQIQFYSISLHIIADFSGLRYIMFHWPIFSATLGICTNLFFLLVVFILSWYHWSDTSWIQEARERYKGLRLVKSDLSVRNDDINNFIDDDEFSVLEEKSSRSDVEEIGSKRE